MDAMVLRYREDRMLLWFNYMTSHDKRESTSIRNASLKNLWNTEDTSEYAAKSILEHFRATESLRQWSVFCYILLLSATSHIVWQQSLTEMPICIICVSATYPWNHKMWRWKNLILSQSHLRCLGKAINLISET